MAKIGDLVNDVSLELGNRADITTGAPSRVAKWLQAGYRQVAMSYRFSEADTTTSINMTSDQAVYAYPPDARAIIDITVYRGDGTSIPLDIKDLAYIRRYNNNPKSSDGPPSMAAYFGNTITVAPAPDNSTQYNMTIDYWQKPQITADIVSTVLAVPDDWIEIVMYAAIMRGHSSLLERDKAAALQQLLFGLTVPGTGKVVPGLMATMYSRYQAEAPYKDWGMAPSAARRSYTSQG